MNPVGKAPSSKSPNIRTKQKAIKPTELSSPSSSMSQAKVNENLSAFTQLKQHSAIEIIPQQKNQTLDFAKNLPKSINIMPQGMPESLKTSGDLSVFEIPKKSANPTNKRNEKSASKDSVEIITLDD